MALGPKLAPPQLSPGTWSAFSRYLYVIFKQAYSRYVSFKQTQVRDWEPRGLLVLISQPKHVEGTQSNRLKGMVLLITQNTCLNWQVRKYLQFYAENVSWTHRLIYLEQGCGNTMPNLSRLVHFHSGQVENFYLLVQWHGQVQMN